MVEYIEPKSNIEAQAVASDLEANELELIAAQLAKSMPVHARPGNERYEAGRLRAMENPYLRSLLTTNQ